MNTKLVKTDYFREKRVDVMIIDGVEYFVVDQIARALEYNEVRTLYQRVNKLRFKRDELIKIFKSDSSLITMTDVDLNPKYSYYYFVNEYGLNRILIHSRAKLAEAFQEWLIYEVLPSIRKRGYYISERADPKQLELELKQRELDIARVKSNNYHLLAEQLDRLERDKNTDPRWISHSRMLLVADITGQRIDFEMEVNLSDFLKEKGHKASESELISFGREVAKLYRKVRGKEPLKTKKQLKTGIREVNYYTVEDIPIIEKTYDLWNIKNGCFHR